MAKKKEDGPIIDLIEVKYEDGYRYMTQEEYNRLYTMKDLQNTISALGSFLIQNQGLLISTLGFLSGFLSFNQNAHARTMIESTFNTETEVLSESFDPEKSYQEFLQRTGQLKPTNTKVLKGFGKSHRLGSALEDERTNLVTKTKVFLTLANFVKYSTMDQGIRFQAPGMKNVSNVLQGGRYLLTLRGGSTLAFSPFILFSFLFSFLGLLDTLRKTKTTIDMVKDILSKKERDEENNSKEKGRLPIPNFWTLLETSKNPLVIGMVGLAILWTMKNHPNVLPETVTRPLGIPRKRTWNQYFRSFFDFRTPTPYILGFSGITLYFGVRNGSTLVTFFREKQPMTVMFEGIFGIANKQFDAYKDLMTGLFKNNTDVFQKTSESNEKFLERTLKDLEASKLDFNKVTEKFNSLMEKNSECITSLSISELNNSYCSVKAKEYGTQSFLLELERNHLSKIYHSLLDQVKDVSSKLYSHDSKALTIPGQTQNLPQFLDAMVKDSHKKYDDILNNLQHTKIPDTFAQLPLPGKKK